MTEIVKGKGHSLAIAVSSVAPSLQEAQLQSGNVL